jgi:hypothetical protein
MQRKTTTRLQAQKNNSSERTRGATKSVQSSAPLGEDRFHELIRSASAFFAQAERDVTVEKTQAIREIQELMAKHGLSIEDLID